MRIYYSNAALKVLKRMSADIRNHIMTRIQGLTSNPPVGDIKPLAGHPGEYRLRVGGYRVLYEYRDGALHIHNIGSRGDVYK